MRARIAGKILLTEGFCNPAIASLIREWGGLGVIAANPGVVVQCGTCITIWGTPLLDGLPCKPKIPMTTVTKATISNMPEFAPSGGVAGGMGSWAWSWTWS